MLIVIHYITIQLIQEYIEYFKAQILYKTLCQMP